MFLRLLVNLRHLNIFNILGAFHILNVIGIGSLVTRKHSDIQRSSSIVEVSWVVEVKIILNPVIIILVVRIVGKRSQNRAGLVVSHIGLLFKAKVVRFHIKVNFVVKMPGIKRHILLNVLKLIINISNLI